MQKKYANLGCSVRQYHPNISLKYLRPLLDQIGITRVANITGLDNLGLPVFACIRPNSKHITVSQGKGITDEQAMISAIMESVESFHAENPRECDIYGKYLELKESYDLVDPSLFNTGFFVHGEIKNLNLGWIRGYNLLTKQSVYVPHCITLLDTCIPNKMRHFMPASSNGLASGNTLAEAMSHAIFEIIERDAIWKWGNQSEKFKNETEVEISSITSSVCQNLIEQIKSTNASITVWEITSNLNIPVYRCLIKNEAIMRNLGGFCGFGAHLSRDIALARAITEAAQSRLTQINGTRDDVLPSHYSRQSHSDFKCMPPRGKRTYSNCVDIDLPASIDEIMNILIQVLKSNEIDQIISVDQTRKEISIPVVQIYIPNLRCPSVFS